MTTSEVTVMTPSFNPGSYIKQAIDSVRDQTYTDWRHIIIDDASTDDYFSKIEEHLHDPRVKLIRNEKNLGQSKTQNIGLEHVETRFILMLDSDDWLCPETIDILLEESKKVDNDVALICGNKQLVWELGNGLVGKYVDRGSQSYDDPYMFLLSNFVPYPRFYRTSALRNVGGWPTDDPYEGRYLEDRRMDVRLIERYKIHWIDRLLYNYRKHSGTLTSKIDIMNEMIEWNIRDALKRWNSKFEPVFQYRDGWKMLDRFIEKTELE